MLSFRRWLPSLRVQRKIALILTICTPIASLFLWRLGNLTIGLSAPENIARQTSLSLHNILNFPLNAPERLLQYGLQALGHHGAYWMRLPSVIFALIFLTSAYLLLRSWFGRFIASLSTIILATTPLFMLLARSATNDIMLLIPITLLLSYSCLKKASPKHLNRLWILFIVTSTIGIYTPGLAWLIIVGGVLARKQLLKSFNSVQRKYQIIGAAAGTLILLPLLLGLIDNLNLAKNLILWPDHWSGLVRSLKDVGWSALSLVWRAPSYTNVLVGKTAILSMTEIVLALFGGYAMWAKARKETYVLTGLIVLGVIGSGLNHKTALLALGLPAIIILVAAGLRFLYMEWRGVFPHNPIPRALAVVVMVALVALQVLYGIRYSLIAWPHTVATRQTYVIK